MMKNTTKAKSSVSAFLRSREGIKWPLIDQAFDKFGGALFESVAAAGGAGAATGGAVGGPLGAAVGSAAGMIAGRLMYTMAVESDRVLAELKYGDAIVTILEKAFEDELRCFSLC